jgi:hypothetical protein
MRADPLTIIVILVVLIVTLYYFRDTLEGYATPKASGSLEGYETLTQKITDRTNPLAQLQNPLANPAAPVGISEAAGTALTSLTQAALNVPSLVPSNGLLTQGPLVNPISPRIDNENSYLGMIKMCKDKGIGERPFDDPAFAANCGMCVTSGTLKGGETFTKPTGVLVYAADKENAQKDKTTNQYIFPRVVPSIDAATCEGSSRSESSNPSLAITQADFDAFRARAACRASHGLGNGCAQCISNKESSWIPANGGTHPLTLWLSGAGNVVVTVGGQKVVGGDPEKPAILSDSTMQTPLGRIKEGTSFNVTVSKGNSVEGPFVYGIITSVTPANKPYKLAIEKFLELDKISGTFVRKGAPKYFSDVKAYSAKLLPQGGQLSMSLDGFIPLTFVEPDQLAAFDCAASPFVSSQASAELMINDPCLNPRGQGPNNYTRECLQQAVLNAGCSTNGTWYKNPNIPRDKTLAQWTQELRDWPTTKGTTPEYTMACKGVDTSTPCDPFLRGGIPDAACMAYLYSNNSESSTRTGRSYSLAPNKFTSSGGKQVQFCQPEGSLNPANANGLAALRGAAGGYNGLTGIEAVKKYLSDVFMKATGNLDINKTDAEGGRKDSWNKCIGAPVADPLSGTVGLNSKNDVLVSGQQCHPLFPRSIDLNGRQGNNIGQIDVTGDYILSFDITLRSLQGPWTNIIHFTTTGNNCCATGDRCPAIWFWPGGSQFHVMVGDMEVGNWGVNTNPIPLNQKVSFKLICQGPSVSVTANGQVINATQPRARGTGRATVWLADPWHPAANALVENLCYTPIDSASPKQYSCRSLVDHAGDDIQCVWPLPSYVGKMMKAACDNTPGCASYNTFTNGLHHGGCIKRAPTHLTNGNDWVKEYCVKN